MKMLVVLLALCAPALLADPCGMVPPLPPSGIVGPAPQIERQGHQKTYVFYRDGIETFAVRPGFKGNVDNFGMLIPVPSMPSIRKIHADTFAHLAAAIDPPVVDVRRWDLVNEDPSDQPNEDLNESPHPNRMNSAIGLAGGIGGGARTEPVVHLLKEEAIGMYQVVVLEAGNAEVLSEWMQENGYAYPEGMDDVCNEYVEAGWLFAAIKAKVGSKDNANPTPGMQAVDASREDGSTFEGHVQGMAFRFKSPELVVPMRLSSYNEGDTRNIVYVLTDQPTAIRDIPTSQVKRQVSGERLYLNLTQPLPVRFINCTVDDISKNAMRRLNKKRSPKPYNVLARELFAGDILSMQTHRLEQDYESIGKEFVNISEELDLRGIEMDHLHREAVRQHTPPTLDTALLELLDMTLTVIDGDFPRDVLRRDNLHFVNFQIDADLNTLLQYTPAKPDRPIQRITANLIGWTDKALEQKALTAAYSKRGTPFEPTAANVEPSVFQHLPSHSASPPEHLGSVHGAKMPITGDLPAWVYFWLGIKAALVIGVLYHLLSRRRERRKKSIATATKNITATSLLCAVALLGLTTSSVNATEPPPIDILPDYDRTDNVSQLKAIATKSETILGQGKAILRLSEFGTEESSEALYSIHFDANQPDLVRAWSLAAFVKSTPKPDDLAQVFGLLHGWPMLGRPLAKRLSGLEELSPAIMRPLFRAWGWGGTPAPHLQPLIQKLSPKTLVQVLLSEFAGNGTRQYVAAVLGVVGSSNPDGVVSALIVALEPNLEARTPPWDFGALYLPSVAYTEEQTTDLVFRLIEWVYIIEKTSGKSSAILNKTMAVVKNVLRSVPDTRRFTDYFADDAKPLDWIQTNASILGKPRIKEFLKRHKMSETVVGEKILKASNK